VVFTYFSPEKKIQRNRKRILTIVKRRLDEMRKNCANVVLYKGTPTEEKYIEKLRKESEKVYKIIKEYLPKLYTEYGVDMSIPEVKVQYNYLVKLQTYIKTILTAVSYSAKTTNNLKRFEAAVPAI